jgi:N utilization substance protein B
MNSRHRAREIALQILYRYDLNSSSKGTPLPAGAELAGELQKHFDHFQTPEDLREFAARLVAGTLDHLSELDPLIEEKSANWKISRMSCVDRMLLRMATYELLRMTETPASVVLNESIELGKEFGTAESPSFINGILDAVAGTLKRKG